MQGIDIHARLPKTLNRLLSNAQAQTEIVSFEIQVAFLDVPFSNAGIV
jgi:hypothetical protein